MKTLTTRSVITGFVALIMSFAVYAQDTVEWFTLGNDYAHTRFTPSNEIDASNFGDLEVAWEWDGACLLYTSPSPRDGLLSRMPSSA